MDDYQRAFQHAMLSAKEVQAALERMQASAAWTRAVAECGRNRVRTVDCGDFELHIIPSWGE